MVFEFGRELRRLFGSETPVRDGLTGGDAALLELLDLSLLRAEARAADIAAGRVGCKDRPARQLEAAVVWREVARRTGDAVVLRKAAAGAEAAAAAFDAERRHDGAARARLEQGRCAMLGAQLFGDAGLEAAAENVFLRVARAGGTSALLAEAELAVVEGRRRMLSGGPVEVDASAGRLAEAAGALSGRKGHAPEVRATRRARAEMLLACASRLKDEGLARRAVADLGRLSDALDSALEPIAHAQAALAAAAADLRLGELTGDIAAVADAVADQADNLGLIDREHSPLDWAGAQLALAEALRSLGEAAACDRALDQAVTCCDRALLVLKAQPGLVLAARAAALRADALALCAELTGDLAVLAAAEVAYKTELSDGSHRRDPVEWALAQLGLAGLYETRMRLTGEAGSDRAGAAVAYDAALDVFAERGLRSLSVLASDGLARLAAA